MCALYEGARGRPTTKILTGCASKVLSRPLDTRRLYTLSTDYCRCTVRLYVHRTLCAYIRILSIAVKAKAYCIVYTVRGTGYAVRYTAVKLCHDIRAVACTVPYCLLTTVCIHVV